MSTLASTSNLATLTPLSPLTPLIPHLPPIPPLLTIHPLPPGPATVAQHRGRRTACEKLVTRLPITTLPWLVPLQHKFWLPLYQGFLPPQ